MGTIEYHNGVDSAPSEMTTPDSKLLANWLAAMVARDTTHAALEVSSHALDQDRTAGTQFDAAIVTNITQDHFDYHHDAAHYRESKAKLLDYLKPHGLVVLNADDPESAALVDRLRSRRPRGHLRYRAVGPHLGHDSGRIASRHAVPPAPRGRIDRNHHFAGRPAQRFQLPGGRRGDGAVRHLARRSQSGDRSACGSFPAGSSESNADNRSTCSSITHTRKTRCAAASDSLKRLGRGRVICTVGAGGDRDRSKRPLIGRAASAADLAIITSDNPRSEDPEQIIREIVSGCDPMDPPPVIEPDRGEAIRRALESAEAGDCVLVAGKGHEREQIIGNRRIPFVDRDVVRAILTALAATSPRRRTAEREPKPSQRTPRQDVAEGV